MSTYSISDFQKLTITRSIFSGSLNKVLQYHDLNACTTSMGVRGAEKSTATAVLILPVRTISTNNRLLGNEKEKGTGDNHESLETFRANEEKIEKEFEAQQKQQSSSDPHGPSTNVQNDAEEQKIQEVRFRILEAALPFVKTNGWGREAISAGAESIGYPGVVHGMFPNGGCELVHHFYAQCNRKLIDQLKKEVEERPADQQAPIPTEYVARAIKLRLQMIEPYIDTWPQAQAVMTLPQNVPTSLAQLLTLVDDICYHAGDRSVDVRIIVTFFMYHLYIDNSFFFCIQKQQKKPS